MNTIDMKTIGQKLNISWTDVVRSRLERGASAYRVDVATQELTRLTAGYHEAWSIWVGTLFVGVLARGVGAWLWTDKEMQVTGDRDDILSIVGDDVATKIRTRDRHAIESGK